MKVAYVTMSFPAPSETFASNDVRRLLADGVRISVQCMRPADPDSTRLLEQRGLAAVPVSYNTGIGSVVGAMTTSWARPPAALDLFALVFKTCFTRPKHLLRSLVLIPRALEVFGRLLDNPPDVVHAYWAHYPALVVFLVQRHMPNVVTSISFSAYDIYHAFPVTGVVARRADFVRTLANINVAETADVFALPRERIEVIYDGVDLDLIPSPMPRVARRVLSVGRLVKGKGMERVIRAFARVHRTFPDSTLRILGSGPELSRLVHLSETLGVRAAVTFIGHVPQEDVLREMRQAEVFLFLSAAERLPNVVKEAMVCGCVCISSRTIGIEELIEDGATGFIVDADDIDLAVERMTETFEGRIDAHGMTRAAEARIRSSFALGRCMQHYQRRWAELVASRRGPISSR